MSEIGTVGDAPQPLRERTAEELRALLARRKMSATQLARHMGVSQAYIWRRLDGQTAFDLDDLEKIANILGVDVLDLFPRSSGGRLIRTAGTDRGEDQQLNVRKGALTEQPRPNGHQKRTSPHPATRRPARLSPVHTH